jgi:hypothetical protein
MTLAPIRGAPPGASIPDFPTEDQAAEPMPNSVTPVPEDQQPPQRQSFTPIGISNNGITLTFRVIPELPAISRASMTIYVVAEPTPPSNSHTVGFLKMSAHAARTFLTDLRTGRSPIVARGDEDGTVEVAYEITDRGAVYSVRKVSEHHVLHRLPIDSTFDVETLANSLLADLGV